MEEKKKKRKETSLFASSWLYMKESELQNLFLERTV